MRRPLCAGLFVAALAAALLVPSMVGAAPPAWMVKLAATTRAPSPGAWRPGGLALASHRSPYVAHEVLVQFRAGLSGALRRQAAGAHGATLVRTLARAGSVSNATIALVRAPDVGTIALLRRFQTDPSVAAASPNYWRHVDALPPDDPGLTSEWGLNKTSVPDAWQLTTGSPDVVIASVDTGVDLLHPDLAPNMWRNPGEIPGNRIDDDHNGYVDDIYGIDAVNHDSIPMDDDGHGTHTSAIAAGIGDNGVGIAGVSWRTRVMALKFLNMYGWGTDAGAVECIDYAIRERRDAGVNIVAINASWGGGGGDLVLRNTITAAGEAGIVVCASAGNDGADNDQRPHYPSSFDSPNLITVAATNGLDRLASFSNYGQVSVDIGAPGVKVLSGVADGQYAYKDGTSMATPFVTGAVALCAALYPHETGAQRIDRILNTVDPEPALVGACTSGGRLNVAAALRAGTQPGADVTAPVTTVLGAGQDARTVPMILRLFAVDEPGGFGVASTSYRVDGGKWSHGARVVVPAARRMRVTHTIEYRSVDRAGNEEVVRSVQVTTDPTGPSAGGFPGPVLPPSPVVGGLGNWGTSSLRTYRLKLQRGQSLRLAVTAPLGNSVAVALTRWDKHAFGRPLAVARPGDQGPLAYRAARGGTFLLILVAIDDGAQSFTLTYDVLPPGVDVVPPQVRALGATERWTSLAATVRFAAADGPSGSGLAAIEVSLDEGLTWAATDQVILPAPADHSNDGLHWVLYRARDNEGNESAKAACLVGIDTTGPTTQAWGPEHPVKRGKPIRVTFAADDASGRVWCQLIVRSVATGETVLTRTVGWRVTPASGFIDDGAAYVTTIDRTLPRGVYDVLVAGRTHDPAGNLCGDAVCARQLVVR